MSFFRPLTKLFQHSRKHRRSNQNLRRLVVEVLEDRTLLSTSIPLNPLSWTALGPAPITNGQLPGGLAATGRISSLAASPTDANTIYAAAAGGGVWKTTDGGVNWTAKTDTQQTLFMGSMAIAQSNPNIIYAGTGEAHNSLDSFYGRGILKSTDAGSTWTLVGNTQFDRSTIAKLIVDPQDANRLYVAVDGFGSNGVNSGSALGIWRSTDGGTNWTRVLSALAAPVSGSNPQMSDIVMDPTTTGATGVLYAACGTYFGDVGNGVYKSTNGGTSWAICGDFPRGVSSGRISLAISPSSPNVLYASRSDPSTSGLLNIFKTTNSGTNWAATPGTPGNYMSAQGWYDQTLIVDPTNANIVYAGGAGNASGSYIVKTSDGGATWTTITQINTGTDGNGPHADHHGIGFDANGKLIVGTDGGVWRLANPNVGSILWNNLNGTVATSALNITQFTGVTIHPTNPDIAFGGSQDNGTERFNDSLGWFRVLSGDGGFSKIASNSGSTVATTTVYATQQNGAFYKSTNGGASFNLSMTGIGAEATNFYVPYEISRTNPNHLLYGSNRVYSTVNAAGNWSPISTTNTNGWTTTANIDTIGLAESDANTVYAATSNGNLFVTTNGGATWTQRAPVTMSWGDIAVDPTNAQTAYIVANQFRGANGSIYKTTNAGVSWTNITNNLTNLPVNAVLIDPRGAGSADDVLYVGADDGVYRSTDQGATWSRFGTGMPNAQVTELDFSPTLHILAAGTHGRGAWEIYNVGTGVSLDASNNLVITAGVGVNDTLTIKSDTSINRFVISDPGNIIGSSIPGVGGSGTNTLFVPFSAVSGSQILVNTFDGNDSLTIDLSLGNFSKTISYDGGTQITTDSLTLTGGGSFANVTHNFTNATSGTVSVTGNSLFSYTGLEPITDNLNAVDRVFNFNGGAETISLVDSVGANMFLDSTAAENVTFANPTGSMTINAGAGDDTVNIDGVDADGPFNAAFTINGGTGNDTINLNSSITLAADKSLNVDLQDDDPTPGTDTITVGASAVLTTSGAGSATLKASKTITMAAGSSIVTVDGGITLAANQQASPTAGNYSGIRLTGATLTTSGNGAILLQGRGGDDGATASHVGVLVEGASLLQSTSIGAAAGTITLQGTGGSGLNQDFGILVTDSGGNSPTVSSVSGDVIFTGQGATGGAVNVGVVINFASQVLSTGNNANAADIAITGTGGSGGNNEFGVVIENGTPLVRVNAGDIHILGTGGSGTSAVGTRINSGAQVKSIGTGAGAGTILIEGIGNNSGGLGVDIENGGAPPTLVTSVDGNITIIGTANGTGVHDLTIRTSGEVQTTGLATVTLVGNSMDFDSTAIIDGGTSTVLLRQRTNGTLINLGSAGGPTAGTLELSDIELGCVTTGGTLKIGDSNSGAMTISADIARGGGVFSLQSGSTVSENSTMDITVGTLTGKLAVRAGGAITLDQGNDVADFAAVTTSGTITYVESNAGGAVNLNAVDGVNGVSTNNAAISIATTDGGLTVSNTAAAFDVDAGNSTVSLTAGQTAATLRILTVNNSAAVKGFGGVTLTANDMSIWTAGLGTAIDSAGNITRLRPEDAGRAMNLGTDTAGAALSITDAELDRVSGTIVLGADGSASYPGVAAGTITVSAAMSHSPDRPITVVTARNIAVNAGWTSATGTLVFLANTQTGPTAGNFIGIDVNNATITSTSGNIFLTGRGGDSGTFNDGVQIRGGGQVVGGNNTTTVMIQGTGGPSTGNNNYGVYVTGAGSRLTSTGGTVQVIGAGGGTGSANLGIGVIVASSGTITAGSNGGVTVQGGGGTSTGNTNHGVVVFDAGSLITSSGGTVQVTGTGGGSGASTNNYGVLGGVGGAITTGGGDITVTGTGGAGPIVGSEAVVLSDNGNISSSGTANIKVVGDSIFMDADATNGLGIINGLTNQVTLVQKTNGVAINLGGADAASVLGLTDGELDGITAGTLVIGNASSGDIDVTAAIDLTEGPSIGTTNLITNAAVLGSGGNVLTVNTLNITPATTLGASGDPFSFNASTLTTLGSGNQFLSEANTVAIGAGDLNAGAGTITLNGGIFQTAVGSDILSTTIVASGATLSGNGTVPTVTVQSGGTVAPGTSPGKLNTGNLTLSSGAIYKVDLSAPYATAGTDYDQINVTGTVTLNDATLTLVGGAIAPSAAATLTILNNDGNASDPILGTGVFAGLPEGATVSVGAFTGKISYFGGDGNDIVLIVNPQFVPGDVFAADSNGSRRALMKVTAGGDFTGVPAFATLTDRSPGQIAWKPDLSVAYITEYNAGAVVAVTPGGGVSTFATGLNGPTGIIWTTGNKLLVAATNTGQVIDITAGGNFSGATPFATGLLGPRNFLQLPTGEILCAEQVSGEITNIAPGGNLSAASAFASGLSDPVDLVRTAVGKIYVTEFATSEVTEITAGGDFTSAPAFATGQQFLGLTIDSTNRLLSIPLSDTRIFDISAGGNFSAASPFAFNLPSGFGESTLDTVPIPPPPDTTVVLSSGNLVITDVNGGTSNDALTISRNGTKVRIHDPNNALQAGAGATQVDATTVEVTFAAITGNIQVNTLAGSDTLTVDFSSGNPVPAGGVAFTGGESSGDDDRLRLVGYTLNTADGVADVTVNHTGPEAGNVVLAGLGTITFAETEPLLLAGTQADLVINLPAGPNTTVKLGDDGVAPFDGTNDANTSAIYDSTAPRSFEYTEFANPTNSLTIGRGSASDNLDTLDLNASGLTSSITVGTPSLPFNQVTIADMTLASDKNLTVDAVTISPFGTATTSGTGGITLRAVQQVGVSGVVRALGSGNILLEGNTAGGFAGNFYGIYLNNNFAKVQTDSGSLTATGKGGAGGGIGVSLESGGQFLSNSGPINVNGTGGVGGFAYGVNVLGSTISSTSGLVTINGTAGTATGGQDGLGVVVRGGQVAGGGGLNITGAGGTGGLTYGVLVETNGSLSTSSNNALNITSDTVFIGTTPTLPTINAGAGTVTFLTRTAGTKIDLGGADVLSGSPLTLGLTNAELNRITAGTIQFGDATAGAATVSAAISRAAATNLNVTTGGNNSITFGAAGSLDANGGNVTLAANGAGSGGVVSGGAAVDVSANILSITAGSAGIGANGNPLVMSVTSLTTDTNDVTDGAQFLLEPGSANITSADLDAGTASVTLAGGTFYTASGADILSPVIVATGATLAGTGATGAVTVQSGGNVAPGASPGILNTGNADFQAGSTYTVEIGGATAGNGVGFHDQLNVTGSVTIGANVTLSLSASGGFTPSAGQSYMIIQNDGTGPGDHTGAFNNLPEGTVIPNFLGTSLVAVITYAGGNGNDVVINTFATTTTVSIDTGNLKIEDTDGANTDDTLTIKSDTTNSVFIISDPNNRLSTNIPGATGHGTFTVTVPFSAVTGSQILVNTFAGNDSLTVDFSLGNFSKTISYDGGTQTTSDSLALTGGGTFASVTHNFTNATSGTVDVTGNGQISYTGLEPITDALSAADRTFNFNAGAETITLTDAAGANMNIDSTLSESVTFANPTTTLTIVTTTGSGSDNIQLNGYDSAFAGSLVVTGGAGEVVNMNAGLTLAANRNLTVDAETINLPNATSDFSLSGNGAAALTAIRNIALSAGSSIGTTNGNITLKANLAGGVAGNFNGITVDAAGLIASGSGNVELTGKGGNDAGTSFHIGISVTGGSTIQSSSGDVKLTGTGGAGQTGNFGVLLDGAATLLSVGAVGSATLIGQGGSGVGDNYGIILFTGAQVTSTGASIDMTGTGGAGTGTINFGIFVAGSADVAATNAGTITLDGKGGGTGGGTDFNHGVVISGAGTTLSTAAGAIQVTGTPGAAASSFAIDVENGAAVTSTGSTVTMIGDTMTFEIGTPTLSAASSTVTLRPKTGSRAIDLGGADSATALGLNNAELNRVTAGKLKIGDSASGAITLSADIGWTGSTLSLESSSSVSANSGADITVTGGDLAVRAGSAITLDQGNAVGTFAASTISGAVTYVESSAGGSLTLGLVDGVTGVSTNNAAVNVSTTDGDLSVTNTAAGFDVDAGNNTLTLTAGQTGATLRTLSISNTAVVRGAGGVTLSANDISLWTSGTGTAVNAGANLAWLKPVSANRPVDLGTDTSGTLGLTDAELDRVSAGSLQIGNASAGTTTISSPLQHSGDANISVVSGGAITFNSRWTTTNGDLTFTGSSLHFAFVGNDIAAATANVTLIADNVAFDAGALIAASGNTVTIKPLTALTAIDLGGADAPGVLGLTNTELDGVAASTLTIGDATTGAVTITGAITRSAATDLNINSGAAINFSTGSLNSAGGNVTLNPGTQVSPAAVGTDVTTGAGTLSFGSGDDLAIAITGATVDTQYDQLRVNGDINVTNVDLVLSGAYAPALGDAFVIVNNLGGNLITGTFNGMPEGTIVNINGVFKKLTYVGGDGNDVVLRSLGSLQATLSGGDLTIDDIEPSGQDNQLSVLKSGTDLVISDVTAAFLAAPAGGTLSNGDRTLTIPLSSITGSLIINGAGGSDVLTVDFATGGFFTIPSGLLYNGGTGVSDSLIVAGGAFTDVVHTFTAAGAGNIVYDTDNGGAAADLTVSYTGLEPVAMSSAITDLTFNLPTASASNAFLEDVGTTSDGLSRLRSGNATFETTSFANPTGSLTISRGNAGDDLTINAVPDLTASVTVGSNAARLDQITFSGAMTLAANNNLAGWASGTISFSGASADESTSGSGTVNLTTAKGITLASGSSIATVNGGITLNANQQGPSDPSVPLGIYINGGAISTTGSGNLLLKGTGVIGIEVDAGGAISSTATGAGAGSITMNGVSNGTTDTSWGLALYGSGVSVTSVDGAIDLTGTGGSGANFHFGVIVALGAQVSGAGSAAITLAGIGGSGGGVQNYGVLIEDQDGASVQSLVTAKDGSIQITGSSNIASAEAIRIGGNGGRVTSTGLADITLIADSMWLQNSGTIDAGARTVTLRPNSAGTAIDLGGNDALNTLGLTSGELDRLTAGTVRIGDAAAGNITLTSQVSPTTFTSLELTTAQKVLDGTLTEQTDLTIATLKLTAANGIGAAGAGDLDFNAANLTTSSAGNNGNQFLTEENSVSAVSMSAGNGMILFYGGTFTLAGSDAVADASSLEVDGGVFAIGAASDTVAGVTLTSGSITGSGGTLTSTAGFVVKSGSASAILGGSVGLTKSTGGSVTFTGANTYTGPTAIDGGVLFVNGSLHASSNVAVNNGGTLAGTGTVNGGVQVNASGSIAPGASPGILNTGSVNLQPNSTLTLEFGGATPGNGAGFHDQLKVTGSVTIGANVTLATSATGGFTPAPGQQFVIIDNDGTGPGDHSGVFAGLPDGGALPNFLGSGLTAHITYTGGDGNDVIITLGETRVELNTGNLLVTDIAPAGKDDRITMSLNGANIRIHDPNNIVVAGAGATQVDAYTAEVPFVNVTGNVQVNTLAGNDRLTIDLATGNPIPAGGVRYDGGASTTSDSLVVTGGSITALTYDAHLAGAGTLTLDGKTIDFLNLEPVTISSAIGTATINLDDGNATAAESLAIQISDGGNPGDGSLLADLSGTFEDLTFAVPSVKLIINGDTDDNDAITLASLDSAFQASLTIDGRGGTDTANLNAAVDIGAGVLDVKADTINFNGSIITSNSAVLDANGGSIVDGNGAANNLTAASALLKATAGVGAPGNPLETTLAKLEGSAGSGFYVANTGSLIIGGIGATVGVSATGGDIAVSSTGTLTLTEPVSNPGGAVTLGAGASGGIVSGASGTDVTAVDVVLTAGSAGIGASGNPLTMSASTLSTNTNAATDGDQYLSEANALTVASGDLDAGSATITLVAGTFVTAIGGDILSAVTVKNGATLAGAGATGPVTVESGGVVSPGSSTAILTADAVSFVSGATFQVEVNGGTAGTDYDQLVVSGQVDLSGATLSTSGTITSGAAQIITLISNTSATPVIGTFAGFPDGSSVTINGVNFTISYTGGPGNNDVVLRQGETLVGLVGNDLIVSDITGHDDTLTLQSDTANSRFVVADPNHVLIAAIGTQVDAHTVYVPFAAFSGDVFVNTNAGNDSLTIDFSLGIFGRAVSYDGGTQTTSDSLTLTGGTFTDVTHSFSNGSSGTVNATGTSQISYSGLEPIADNLTATNRFFNFNGGAETITLNDAAGAKMTIDSDLGEAVTFTNPTAALTISAGTGADDVTIASVDSSFGAALTINGDGGSDAVHLNADLLLAAGNNLDVTSDAITVGANADLATTGAGTITLTGDSISIANSATLNAGVQTVTLKPQSATTLIDLGGADAPATLGLSDGELNRITAGVLRVGSTGSAAIHVSAPINPALAGTLSLVTGSGITQSAGSTITAAKLAVEAGGAVVLAEDNDADVIAASASAFTFHDLDDLAIGTAGGLSGIGTDGGAIDVSTDGGNLNVGNVSVESVPGAGTIALTAGGAGRTLSNVGGLIQSADAAITLTADRMDLGSTANRILAGAGRVTLQPYSAGWKVDVGSSIDTSANTLELSNAELGTVTTTGALQIGGSTTGAIAISTNIAPGGASTLALVNNGAITDSSGITVTNLRISSAGPVTLDGDHDVTNLAAKISGAGNAFLFHDVNGMTLTSIDGVDGVATTDATLTLSTTNGPIDVVNTPAAFDVDAGTGILNMTARNDFAITLGAGATTLRGAGGVNLTANHLAFLDAANSVNAGAAAATLLPFDTGTLIDLGGGDAVNILGLSDAELDSIAAAIVKIGNASSGDIRVRGPIDPAATSQLELTTGGRILDLNPAGIDIAETRLALNASSGIGVGDPLETGASNLEAITNTGGIDIANSNASGLTLGGVTGALAGVTAQTGNIRVRNLDGSLSVTEAVSQTGGAGIALAAAGNLSLAAPVSVNAAGTITLDADTDNVGGGDIATTAAGSVTTTGGNVALRGADIDLAGAVKVTTGAASAVSLRPRNDSALISLGADFGFGLTDADLGMITAGQVQIGAAGQTGGIDVVGAIDVTDAPVIALLKIITGGAIFGSGGNVLTANTLGLTAGTTIGAGGDPFRLSAASLTSASAGVQFLAESNTVDIGAAGLSAGANGIVHLAGGTFITAPGKNVLSNAIIDAGATLAGSGVVTGALIVNAGGTVSPGTSAGLLGAGTTVFAVGSFFNVELAGATAGVTYDQLYASGSASLGSATLVVSGAPATGVVYAILQSAGAVSGQFAGLPEGTTVLVNGAPFEIHYQANRVLLSRDSTPVVVANDNNNLIEVRKNAVGEIEVLVDNVIVMHAPPNTLANLSISGQGGNDRLTINFNYVGGPFNVPIVFNGNDGLDMLVAPNVDNYWNLLAPNFGTLANIASSVFANTEFLSGGSGRDIFHFSSGGSIAGLIQGGAGSDWLDYSAVAGPVAVNMNSGGASLTGAAITVENILGSALGGDLLIGDENNNILVAHGARNLIFGQGGRDVIIGGYGSNYLDGGTGDDLLIAGLTAFDSNYLALEAIMAEWSSGAGYDSRVYHLRTGTGQTMGIALLPGATVAMSMVPVGPHYGQGGGNDQSTVVGGLGQDYYIVPYLIIVVDFTAGLETNN